MIRILAFCLDTSDYGDRSQELMLCEEIAKQGHYVAMCSEIDPVYKGDKPISLDAFKLPVNSRLSDEEMKTELDKHGLLIKEFDVVFATSISGANWANCVARLKGIKSVVQLLDVPYWRLNSSWKELAPSWLDSWRLWINDLLKSDYIISNHSVTTNHLLNFGIKREVIFEIIYGMDIDMADSVPEIPYAERKADICIVNRLVFYKGYDLLFASLGYLKNKYNLNLKVAVIGGTPENQDVFKLSQMAVMLGLNVWFMGPVPNKKKFEIIKNSKIGVTCDYCEEIGCIFPLEAMYCGLPVICWDMQIHKERFEDNAHYITKFDIVGFAEKIKELLNQNIKDNPKGKEFVKNKRSFEVHANGLIGVFEKCLN